MATTVADIDRIIAAVGADIETLSTTETSDDGGAAVDYEEFMVHVIDTADFKAAVRFHRWASGMASRYTRHMAETLSECKTLGAAIEGLDASLISLFLFGVSFGRQLERATTDQTE